MKFRIIKVHIFPYLFYLLHHITSGCNQGFFPLNFGMLPHGQPFTRRGSSQIWLHVKEEILRNLLYFGKMMPKPIV
jgi:hypothetical protein